MRRLAIICFVIFYITVVQSTRDNPRIRKAAKHSGEISSMYLPQIEEPPRNLGRKHSTYQLPIEKELKQVESSVKHAEVRAIKDDGINKHEKREAREQVTYVGAVLEYESYDLYSETEGGAQALRVNANNFVGYAAEAKNQGADIMVTPEYGLQSLNMFANDTEKMITYCQYVPNPIDKVAIWQMDITSLNNIEAMSILSQGAYDKQIYLSINLAEMEACSAETIPNSPFYSAVDAECPESGYFFYNTQTVFDRDGVLIARYRKQNLYLEDQFTPGPLNDTTALFQTDFDVAFTMQVCFDIVWEHPGYTNVLTLGIKDVAMGTAWVDELPYTLADSVFSGWSRGLNANLLVAGHHLPNRGKLGSGIFRNYQSTDEPVYTYDKESGSVLLVANITTLSMSSLLRQPNSKLKQALAGVNVHDQTGETAPHDPTMLSIEYPEEFDGERVVHTIIHTNLENFTTTILPKTDPGTSNDMTSCSNGLCCDLTYEYSGNLTYMYAVYSGAIWVGFGTYRVGVQICSVLWCRNEDVDTCARVETGLPEDDSFGPFSIEGVFESTGLMVTPGGLYRDLTLVPNADLIFTTDVPTSKSSLTSSKAIDNALTLALFGRWYSNV